MQIAHFAGEFIHIIVGIDGGKTAAIACIDLYGRPIRLFTGRYVGLSWFVDMIRDVGEPVIIASDKKKPDEIVKKLGAVFGAVVFSPQEDLTVEKKEELANRAFENLHERDALAAAKAAYNAYANKLKQASKKAIEHGIETDKAMTLVIERYSIHEAITGKKANRKK